MAFDWSYECSLDELFGKKYPFFIRIFRRLIGKSSRKLHEGKNIDPSIADSLGQDSPVMRLWFGRNETPTRELKIDKPKQFIAGGGKIGRIVRIARESALGTIEEDDITAPPNP